MTALKGFVKLHKSPLLIANIVQGAVLSLKTILGTTIPLKMMRNAFCFTLKASFVLLTF